MDDLKFVVSPDGRVLSKAEVDEATGLDERVSVDGAPDTRREDVLRIEIERLSQWIHKEQQHNPHSYRIPELQAELRVKQAQLDALGKVPPQFRGLI